MILHIFLLVIYLITYAPPKPVEVAEPERVINRMRVPGILDVSVVWQPNMIYITNNDNEVTQLQAVKDFGNVGLAAHSHLSGKLFYEIDMGQEIQLFYDDGKIETFVVTEILRFQALSPTDPHSSFIDLHNNQVLSSKEVFSRVYQGAYHLTLQTCIEMNNDPGSGRLFIIAVPAMTERGIF